MPPAFTVTFSSPSESSNCESKHVAEATAKTAGGLHAATAAAETHLQGGQQAGSLPQQKGRFKFVEQLILLVASVLILLERTRDAVRGPSEVRELKWQRTPSVL